MMCPQDLLARVGQLCVEQRQQLEAGSEKVKQAPDCAHLARACVWKNSRSLVGYSPWGHNELDMTQHTLLI